MSDLDELAQRAVDQPIRTPPPLAQVLAVVARRRRRRFAGAVAGMALVAVGVGGAVTILGGSGDAERVETAAATSAPSQASPDAPEAEATTSPAPNEAPALDTVGLITGLKDREAVVEEVSAPPSTFFTGAARGLCVNGSQLQVFEYQTVSDRVAESSQITPDGQPNDRTLASWIGPPRFFAAGTLIALDLSGDVEIENLLGAVMGPTLSPDGIGFDSGNANCEAPSVDAEPTAAEAPGNQPQPELSPEVAQEAERVVTDFLDALKRGDMAAAGGFWTGYPIASSPVEAELVRLVDTYPWLVGEAERRLLVVPSFGWVDAQPVVTVVSGDSATSFVLALPQQGEPLMIERLPDTEGLELPVTPRPGETVIPGETVVFELLPMEGGARAFLDDQELVVIVDHESVTTSVVLPEELPAQVVLTLTGATPEVPGSHVVVYIAAEQ